MPSIYEDLIPPFQAIVDRLLRETEGEGWEVRRAYLASVFAALQRGPDGIDPEEALSDIIAAVIERMEEPAIEGRLQAGIYAASTKPDHRIASAEWFDLHPDEYQLIQEEMARGGRLN